jgi:hypothetical protein
MSKRSLRHPPLTTFDDWNQFIAPENFSIFSERYRRTIYKKLRDNVDLLAFMRAGSARTKRFSFTGVSDGPGSAIGYYAGSTPRSDLRSYGPLENYYQLKFVARPIRQWFTRDERASWMALEFLGFSYADIRSYGVSTLFSAAHFNLDISQVERARELDIDFELMASVHAGEAV